MEQLANMLKRMNKALAVGSLALLLLFSSCAGNEIFPDIGDKVYNPISVALDTTAGAERLYLVNSNYTVYYKSGSFQVYDISKDATAPVLMDTVEINNFSGNMHYDAVGKFVYLTNRYSEEGFGDPADIIYKISVDEASSDYLVPEQFSDGRNPFGLFYDTVSLTYYVASANSALDYFTDPNDIKAIDLSNLKLSGDDTLGWSDFRDVVVVGTQAWLTRASGGVVVYDLAGEKCDYFISDFASPRAVATDGTNVYMTSTETVNNKLTPLLYVLDPSTLPTRTGNTTCEVTTKADVAGFIVASPTVGTNPQEILLSTGYIFVSNQDVDTVSVIDRTTNVEADEITVGDGPFGLGLYSPAGVDTYVYVTNLFSNNVSVIDIPTLKVLTTF